MRNFAICGTVVVLALYVAFCLSGCASVKPPSQVICLPIKDYSAAEQKALAAALAPLPEDSMLLRAILDYGAMRDAARACKNP